MKNSSSVKTTKAKQAAKPVKKRSPHKKADIMRNLGGLLLIAIVGTAMFAGYRTVILHKKLLPQKSDAAIVADQKAEGDKVFRNYLVKLASTKNFEVETNASEVGTDTKMNGKTVYDTVGKKVSATLDVQCSNKNSGGNVSLDASFQSDNAAAYFKVNSIRGTFNTANGQTVDSATRFAKIIDSWYQEIPNTSTQSEIDSGVFMLEPSVISLSSEPQKVADAFINNQALTTNVVKKDNGDYSLFLIMHKAGYIKAYKQAFPTMTGSDKVIDEVFGADDVTEKDATVVVHKDGTIVSQQLIQTDQCRQLIDTITGTVESFSGIVTEDDTPKPAGSFKITPVTGARTQAELQRTLAQ
jgi:hypothetical protein